MNSLSEAYDLKKAQALLPWLKDNACELTWAIEDPRSIRHQLPLVAVFNHRLYYTKSWVGNVLRKTFLYLQGSENQASQLNETLIQTIQAISRCIPSFLQYYEEHYAKHYYNFTYKAIPLEEEEMKEASRLLKRCSSAFLGFGILFTESKYESSVKKIEHFLPSDCSYQNLCHRLRKAQCLVNLEGILDHVIPMPILAKLCRDEKLSSLEKGELEKWMKKLEAQKNRFKIRDLEEAFIEIIRIINLENSKQTTLDDLLLNLDQFSLFTEVDQNHVQIRNGLRLKKAVSCNGKLLRLEKQLSPHKLKQDHYQVFSIVGEEHANHVLKIGKNCLELKINKIKIDKERAFIEKIQNQNDKARPLATGEWHIKFIEIDQEGKCAILERLEFSLAHYQWKSNKLPLDPKEEKMVDILARRLNLMCQKWVNQVPKNLNLKNLMVDSEGHIKFLGLLEMGDFNYNKLEQFCSSILNPFIRSRLMRGAGLIEHETAKFYQRGVEYAIQYGKTNELRNVQAVDFEKGIYETHLQKLNDQALELRVNCIEQVKTILQEEGLYDDERQLTNLTKAVCDELICLYQESSTPGILQPNLEEGIINNYKTIYENMMDH